MASIINASTTSTSGLVQTADASGVLQLQSNGVTGLTVGTGGVVTAANGMVFSSMTLGTATAGEFEYDGRVPYFTPAGTQRGVIPGMQMYTVWNGVVGSNATGNQSILGVGVTLNSNTTYVYELYWYMSKSAGTTSHTVSINYGGTATLASHGITYYTVPTSNGTLTNNPVYGNYTSVFPFVFTGAITTSSYAITTLVKGTVGVTTGGTFIPQYALSAAPGGAYTVGNGYMYIYPVGTPGAPVNVGTWA